jgi:hydroxymethylpyrimidine/phosphomethylpyrimidine kinase
MTAAAAAARQRCVLVFSGADPSGGAGIAADILAIHAQGAHALPVITALTVQDNERVFEVLPVEPDVLLRQARALMARVTVDAVKIGITGSAANARAIAQVVAELRAADAALPVVLDPVLASGHGDLLSRDDAAQALGVLLPLVTLLTPNGPEAAALAAAYGQAGQANDMDAAVLLAQGCRHVLVTGGHGGGDTVSNRWFSAAGSKLEPAAPARRIPRQRLHAGRRCRRPAGARLPDGAGADAGPGLQPPRAGRCLCHRLRPAHPAPLTAATPH